MLFVSTVITRLQIKPLFILANSSMNYCLRARSVFVRLLLERNYLHLIVMIQLSRKMHSNLNCWDIIYKIPRNVKFLDRIPLGKLMRL